MSMYEFLVSRAASYTMFLTFCGRPPDCHMSKNSGCGKKRHAPCILHVYYNSSSLLWQSGFMRLSALPHISCEKTTICYWRYNHIENIGLSLQG